MERKKNCRVVAQYAMTVKREKQNTNAIADDSYAKR